MSLKATILLEKLLEWSDSERPFNHLLQAGNEMKSSIENRIFNSEGGGKDIEGKGFGNYSSPYEKQRAKLGRQTARKDFEFTGDLRRSIVIEQTPHGIRIFINKSVSITPGTATRKAQSISNLDKAKYLTNYQKKEGNVEIFKASNKEKKKYYLTVVKLLENDMKQIAASV